MAFILCAVKFSEPMHTGSHVCSALVFNPTRQAELCLADLAIVTSKASACAWWRPRRGPTQSTAARASTRDGADARGWHRREQRGHLRRFGFRHETAGTAPVKEAGKGHPVGVGEHDDAAVEERLDQPW